MDRTKALYNACSNFELEYTKWEHFGKEQESLYRVINASLDLYDELMRFLQFHNINTLGLGDK